TIYLILSRPVSRWVYLTGKYIGIVSSVIVSMLLMAGILCGLLLIKKVPIDSTFAQILIASALKITIVGALTLLVSLISTSVLSCVVIVGIFYTLGHFMAEIQFISGKINIFASILTKPIQYIIPNMVIFNLNDILNADKSLFAGWFNLMGYTLVYSAMCVVFAIVLFRKKEF
ncbi:MAG TPA: ABC transporter permease subunit, partial [Elusimicrobiales bacterium]|nr:ABC transporter permease subunit [Elusimicrobiales bacterium]